MPHYVYMIKNSENQLYIGISDNPQRRLIEHNTQRGAQMTGQAGKFQIVFLESYPNLTLARRREIQIKKWRREKKEMLILRYRSGRSTHLLPNQSGKGG